jgi:hypothetical protein
VLRKRLPVAKLYSPAGGTLIPDPTERVTPVVAIDTQEGKFNVPVAVIATFQYAQLVEDIAAAVMKRFTAINDYLVDTGLPNTYTVGSQTSKDDNVLPSS